MAITKISQYNSSPTDETDYQAQNEHLQAFINQLNGSAFILSQTNTSSVPAITQGSYIMMGGTVYIVDTSNYTIQGTITSGSTNYIYLTVSGDNLIATWTTDISGYSWNSVYNYMSDGTNILLPYSIIYDGTNYLMGGLNKVFNQNLNTYNNVSFANINPPVDNNDASMPSVGIGGFSYAVGSTGGAYPSITIGSGGTWVYVASSTRTGAITEEITTVGRISGGSSVQGQVRAIEDVAYVSVIAWRIA